jgi:glycosyltransferase involved in cell wall biosynthesis
VLANRYREDLVDAGIGTGGHAFSFIIPGGLSPLVRHIIQVVGEADGCEMPGSPVTLEPSDSFDAALEHAVSRAVGALATPEDRAHVLAFLAAQSERLLQDGADAASGRESRLIRRQLERRWGRPAEAGSDPTASRRRALVIDDLVPVTDRDAGSSAILSHMRGLQLIGYEVTFVAAAELSPPAAALEALEARGIECCHAPYYASVEEVLRRQPGGFEVVYLHRAGNAAKYLALVRECIPRARTVYSVADLHHVRVARQAKIEERQELLALSRRLRIDECMAAATANVVITHSAFEAAWLLQVVKECNVHVVPWEVPLRPASRSWGERQGIAFVGGFRHAPNLDAVRFLAGEIMPRVQRADPSIVCSIIGADMPASIRRLAGPGIVTTGYVPDMQAVHDRVRLMVAPLRYGAGAKGKVLESFAAGLPCVMTSIAAEGLRLPAPFRASIADDAANLAERIVRLHADEAAASVLAQAGSAYVAAHWNEQAVVGALKSAIEGPRRPAAPMAASGGQTSA